MSRASNELFTQGAPTSFAYCADRVDSVQQALEQWRLSVPSKHRPCCPLRESAFSLPYVRHATIHIRSLYFILQIALARLMIHVCGSSNEEVLSENKRTLMNAARNLLDLTQFITIDASTPLK